MELSSQEQQHAQSQEEQTQVKMNNITANSRSVDQFISGGIPEPVREYIPQIKPQYSSPLDIQISSSSAGLIYIGKQNSQTPSQLLGKNDVDDEQSLQPDDGQGGEPVR